MMLISMRQGDSNNEEKTPEEAPIVRPATFETVGLAKTGTGQGTALKKHLS
jgi:hypothetical protein